MQKIRPAVGFILDRYFRVQILPPIRVSANPDRAADDAYVDRIYGQVRERI